MFKIGNVDILKNVYIKYQKIDAKIGESDLKQFLPH